MNATIGPPPARFTDLPLDHILESPWNPRKHHDAHAEAELVASIKQVGLLTPLLVRPVSVDAKGRTQLALDAKDVKGFELAAGHRRRRAAAAAGLEVVPVQIRYLDDDAFREILVIENLQRADVHPLDEADAYAAILERDGAYTVDNLAARVGKSQSYVYKRLKLTELIPTAREHYWKDEITAAHAERLARLAPAQQARALDVCFYPLTRAGASQDEGGEEAMTPYTFEVQQVARPVAPSRSDHAGVIDAALATAGTGRSVIITPGKGQDAQKLLGRLRTAITQRAKKTGEKSRVRGALSGGKVYLWCEGNEGAPRPTVPAAAVAPPPAVPMSPGPAPTPAGSRASHVFDPIEARVVKALELDEGDGLQLDALSRAVYGRSDAERKKTGLLVVLNNLCKRMLLLQDGEKRYTLGHGVRSGIA